MRLLSFITPDSPRQIKLGAYLNDCIVDLASARTWTQGACHLPGEELPASLPELVHEEGARLGYINNILQCLQDHNPAELKGSQRARVGYLPGEVALLPPILHPTTLRVFQSFRGHVQAVHSIQNTNLPQEWLNFPAYFYENVNAVYGPDAEIQLPAFTKEMDFELNVACIIGKFGRNIAPEHAEDYILGYSIFNDWTARDIQRKEMNIHLGSARSKDFASSLGPYLVTPDELADCGTTRPAVYDLEMTVRLNNKEVGRGSWKDMHYSFGDMIARASLDTYLVPGDVIASGCVTGGCLLETTRGSGPWLKVGDTIELGIDRMGNLKNTISLSHQAGE